MVQVLASFIISLVVSASFASGFESIGNIRPKVPNEKATPGRLCDKQDPDFSELRYKEHVAYCQRNVDFWRRSQIYDSYRVPENIRNEYTIDHLIPLSLGGSNSSENLWPEHRKIKATRPFLEQELFEALRDGKITQKKAIEVILDAKLNPEKYQ